MNINTELLAPQLIKPRLQTWFNAQSVQERTIPVGQSYFIKITVLQNASGAPSFVIGSDPITNDPTRTYVGEATYLWVGPTGVPALADATSFFELAKTVETAIRIVPYTLTVNEGTSPT